jgi:hypothetical protein
MFQGRPWGKGPLTSRSVSFVGRVRLREASQQSMGMLSEGDRCDARLGRTYSSIQAIYAPRPADYRAIFCKYP